MFDVELKRDRIALGRDSGQIVFSAGEGENLKELLAIVEGMQSLPVLPPTVSNSPFRIRFTADDTFHIFRADEEETSIEITWSEIDNFIRSVDSGIAKTVDKNRYDTSAKPSFMSQDIGVVIES